MRFSINYHLQASMYMQEDLHGLRDGQKEGAEGNF